MKKLLSILGAVVLIGTASTNVIACDRGEKPSPTPVPPESIPISKNQFTELSNFDKTIWSSVSYNNIIYVGTDNGIYQNSDNNKDKFLQINGIRGRITSLTADKNGNIFATTQYDNIYKKQINENQFTLLNNFNNAMVWSSIVSTSGIIWVGTSDGLYKSNDEGTNWIQTKGTQDLIRSFVFDNQGNIYASSENGTVYKSIDGVSFTPMLGTDGLIYTLAFDSKNKIIYAGSKIDDGKGALYKSTDGINFQKVKEIQGEIHSLTVNNDGILFIGTKFSRSLGTVYSYSDYNKIEEIKGTQGEVFTLTISNDNNVYAGTWREDSTGSFYILK